MNPYGDHLTLDELRELPAAGLARGDIAGALVHLGACDSCHQRFRRLFPDTAEKYFRRWYGRSVPLNIEGISQAQLEEIIRRGTARMHSAQREIERARICWAEIRSLHRGQRRLLVLNAPRFHTVGFGVVVLEAAKNTWLTDPVEAADLSDLALGILERVPASSTKPDRLQDLRARALAYRANCRRICGDWSAAKEDFREAHVMLKVGTGDRAELALVLENESTLLRSTRSLKAARERLQAAVELYEEYGDVQGEARAVLTDSLVLREAGQPERGIRLLEGLLARHDLSEVSSEEYYRCRGNLLLLSIETGRLDEAHDQWPTVRRLVEGGGNRFELARLKWVEALLHDRYRDDDVAEARYREVQQFFLEMGIWYDAASVSLDLAGFYFDRGHYAEARELATILTPILAAEGMPPDALAAMTLFQQANLRVQIST